jgi:hypothetical protein
MRVPAALEEAWAGIDVGKRHHWVCVADRDGRQLLSVKVANDEAEIAAAIGSVTRLAGKVTWAVDIVGAPSALLLALLSQAGQPVRYASGRLVAAMSGAYPGEGKTDPQDAFVIAETARLRRSLPVIDHKTDRFAEFSGKWEKRYPAIIRLWENVWAEFVPFLRFDREIRTVICTTNAIESINARLRRAVNARGHFPPSRPPSSACTWRS